MIIGHEYEEYCVSIEQYIGKFIVSCHDLGKNKDKDHIEQKYIEMCTEASEYLTQKFSVVKDNDMYEFFSIYITTFHNYMLKNSQTINADLNYLFSSAIRKYRDILYCKFNQDYESGIILTKSLYENILIMDFLSLHRDCIKTYIDHSVYILTNRLLSKIGKSKEKNIDILKKNIDELKAKYGEDIDADYGWAKSVIKKDNITSKDIHEIILGNIVPIDMMNEIVFDLIFSNVSGFARLQITGEDNLKLLLNKNLEVFCVQMLVKCFYDMFCDDNYFEANIFLKISEFSLEKWGYNFNIR